ncbi:MFS general substrate transporter [Eremomyces bilateralis CBS 781.70]|uniref:MFS general substrate transporter n=1 Tax=Eremomyces bilateralis CBS 781.70 TaxID=1392243 RepID=A0A6G1GEN8_9PEZI|nr:MFS general substrate transporter [Eremomyces bilateralis CBS 781.70]KAF1816494.1 MFS general substrate transporter [Eremomyces bilateralis CBS 781.70]
MGKSELYQSGMALPYSPNSSVQRDARNPSYLSQVYTIISVALLFTAFFLAQYDRFILSYFQLPLTTELNISSSEYAILSGYATGISFAILSIPLASIADRSKARLWILTLSIAWWSLSVVFQGLAHNYWQIATARVSMGIGQSAVEALTVSLISDLMGPRRYVSTGEGVLYMGIYVGEAISGQISTVFRRTGTSWRWALKGVGIFGIGLAIVIRVVMWKEPRRRDAIARSLTDEGEGEGNGQGTSFRNTLNYVISMRSFWLYTLAAGVRTLSGVVFGYYMPGYLQQLYPETKNLTSVYGIIVGVVGSATSLSGGLVTSALWPKTKLTPLYLVSAGGVLSSVFVILMVFSRELVGDKESGVKVLYGTLAAAYVTAELWLGPVNGLLVILFPPKYKTFAFSIYSAIVVLIYSSGPEIVGLALDGVNPDSENYAQSLKIILAVIIPLGYILSSIGFALCIPLVKADIKRQRPEFKSSTASLNP